MKKVFVSGLPYETTQEELFELIKPYGRIVEAKLIMDRTTGKSKGFGFVEMSSEDEAKAVIRQLDGRYVGTRKLFVNEARPEGTLASGAPRPPREDARPPRPAAPPPGAGAPGGVERRSGQDRRKNPGFGSPASSGERREFKKPWEKKPWSKDKPSFGDRKPWSKDKPGFGDKKPWEKKPWDKDRKPGFGGKKPWGEKKPWSKDKPAFGAQKPWSKDKPGAGAGGKPWEKKPWDKKPGGGFGAKKDWGKKPFAKGPRPPFGKKPGGFRKPSP